MNVSELSTNSSNLSLLRKFQAQVPHILIRHLITSLILKYGLHKTEMDVTSNCCFPASQRFQGALLFVDISGFTALSQRLTVDKLRIVINSFFKKILDIIFKHGGDVVKFAGDAIYAIWPISVDLKDSTASKLAMDSAVTCGLEITRCCDNYRVNLSGAMPNESQLASMLMMSVPDQGKVSPPSSVSPHNSQPKKTECQYSNESVAYLSVHAGASFGTMAGMDVGANDRWEYLMVGQPVLDVAEAESEARKGELVISAAAHGLLHGDDIECTGERRGHLPCGCECTKSGFIVRRIRRNVSMFTVAPTSTLFGLSSSSDDLMAEQIDEVYEDTDSEADDSFATQELLREVENYVFEACELLTKFIKDRGKSESGELLASDTERLGISTSEESAHPITSSEHQVGWINACLLEDVFRHVHEADRLHYTLQRSNRYDDLASYTRNMIPSVSAASSLLSSQRGSVFDVLDDVGGESLEQSLSPCKLIATGGCSPPRSVDYRSRVPLNSSQSFGSCSSSSRCDVRSESKRSNYSMISMHDNTLVGELRTVIVMFVSIKMGDLTLLIDPPSKDENAGEATSPAAAAVGIQKSFGFIARSEREAAADDEMLSRYQQCMAIMTDSMHVKGGQLRQFIVDDKGTVCIGTFGLRGSTNDDNNAAAIDSAHEILVRLGRIGLQASIGITSGKAYCGIVGSQDRHEYSVMGPSTNLSARLMCSAENGEIRCGSEVRQGDRVHSFVRLGEVFAKGYNYLVPTFKPLFNSEGSMRLNQSAKLENQQSPCSGGRHHVADHHHQVCFGRDKELARLYSVIPALQFPHESEFMYDVSAAATMAVLVGPHGIGKTTLLEAFDRKVSTLRLLNKAQCNLSVFRVDSHRFNTSEPLSAWKAIMCQVFQAMALHMRIANTSLVSNTSRQVGVSEEPVEDLHDSIMARLSPEFVHLKPLLADMGVVDRASVPETSQSAALSSVERFVRTQDLLLAILQDYCVLTNDRLLIIFDDLHRLDSSSLDLVLRVFSQNCGVDLLLAYRPGTHRTLLSDPCSSFMNRLPVSERCERVALGMLDVQAIKDLVNVIFLRCGIYGVDASVMSRFHQVSGGSPLYAFELAKAVTEKHCGESSKGSSSGSREDSGNNTREEVSAMIADILTEFETNRVEEIILFRFDQLQSACQLILKMAAVACINGGLFTLDMISYITLHYQNNDRNQVITLDEDLVRENVRSLFMEIVALNEFVRISSHDAQPSQETTSGCENAGNSPLLEDLLDSAQFEFIVELEKRSLYDLMLDNQKQVEGMRNGYGLRFTT